MNNLRNLALWIIIALLLVALFNMFQGTANRPAATTTNFTEFNQEVVQGQVKKVTIQGDQIKYELGNGQAFTTYSPSDPELVSRMLAHNVAITVQPADDGMPTLMGVFINWFPMLLLIGVWIFFLRQMQAGGGKAMGFGKSRAKLLTERTGRVTFEDVAGVDEAKEELKEIVEFLRDPQKFQRLGGRIPKGVLLVGPPGTGKTLLARAIAGEANVPFFTISGSDFVEMFVGVGASRVRDMFEQAKKNAPCIVFIDEIDAVGRHRGAGLGGGNDEREQTLNQLLVEMDGFESTEGVILIAATNRPDVLDPALLRPGRFDRHVVVSNPDLSGREKILRVHMRKVPLATDVDPRVIARGTPGFSGADLANLVNEAALLAARRGKRVVTMTELEDAKDKVLMGAERRSLAMTDEEKKLTAYHEGGHAIVALNVKGSDPIHKATIIPRGRALGMVMRLPERDQLSVTREKMLADICVAFGGRIAEEQTFGHEKVTTGAMSDIEMATRMARAMVTRFGMSDELGPLAYAENQDEVFLGHTIARQQTVSEATAQKIDQEIRTIINNCFQRAQDILQQRADDLQTLAKGLLEYETLTGDEIVALLKGIPPVRAPYEEPEPQRGPGPSVPQAGRPRGIGGPIAPEPQPGR
ncbi:MAG TPA: ATP-dependent zinc metalloprotease FtsH [Rhizomicrobium sp.]|nr:ATP-dependent zinc metalloprotease FtsH [Rhizomicrobium sp.]